MGVFCELSRGRVDYLAFKQMLEEIQFEASPLWSRTCIRRPSINPLPIAKRNRRYLREIGIG